MKISDNFPILQKANALFLVTGKQSAIIYRLRKGEISERETIEIKTPTYSDKEGRFESRGARGRLQGSGSVYDSNKTYIQENFLKNLLKELKNIKLSYDSIYLFAPKQISGIIEGTLPKIILNKVKRVFDGNFTKLHPTELLTKIKSLREFKEETEARNRVTGEAAKILRRGQKIMN